ncbi:MAG: tyrosine-type recombinase/integrase [Lachnospiraceae bacterium]|nr:tyrosine-type recombinase/integrase [Lachnospiraceae bacterium]
MVTDYEKLVLLCDEELRHREYESRYYMRITRQWDCLREWLNKKGISEFNEEIGNRYCDEMFGTHLMPKRPPVKFRENLRAVRMLVSYQKNGDFEFRCHSVEYIFNGSVGETALAYLDYCKNDLVLAEKTIENKRLYLCSFCNYLNVEGLGFDDLSIEETERFFASMGYTLASRHNAARNIKLFLQFAYDSGKSIRDTSVFILPDNYKKDCKLPTTYEENEIKELISSVERASAIGKRDYLILLLATEYGWRAKDITRFSFGDIDWDNNVIHFSQHKTDVPVDFPLLSTVGNAIIDYLKYARPETDVPEIIVSMENANKGKPLSSPTIHSVVTKYMKRAGIKNWQNKKHGPHAMRHSLATNLLRKNVAMPVISTVMGHQRTETTSVYISVDYDKLKQCALPMPVLHSPFYRKEGRHGKV